MARSKDDFTSTVDAAAAFEAARSEPFDDPTPTRLELLRDEGPNASQVEWVGEQTQDGRYG